MNATAAYRFTIVVPVFNERDNLPELEKRLSAYLEKTVVRPACVLFVDDGSTDGGNRLLEEICRRNKAFYCLRFTANYGLSAALKAGFDHCESPLVGYIDSDLQTDPEDFDLLLPHAEEHAMVMGIRTKRKDRFSKRLISIIANSSRRRIVHDTARDTGCPLKVLQTSYARQLPCLDGMHRFLPSLISNLGGDYLQIPVHHHPRTAGQSKFNLKNRFWGPIRDAFGYRWYQRRRVEYTIENSQLD
jgi:glycosyltransferase involved in cell wall biosynthesis